MTSQAQTIGHEAVAEKATESFSNSIKGVGKSIVAWVETCADYWAAAALYDSLRGLSDAELHKRGLSRDSVALHSCQACDRTMCG